MLGLTPVERGVLLSDGYGAYGAYVARTGLTHAQCWAHCRREFIEAEQAEPAPVAEALRQFRELYAVEARIRARKLEGPAKLAYRRRHARPLVDTFFAWIEHRFEEHGWLPSNP